MPVTSPRASARTTQSVNLNWSPAKVYEWVREIAQTLSNVLDGKINSTGTVTLTANAATSTLLDERIGPDSVILFMPTTSNAASALSGLYVSSRGKQTATLTHANNAQSDRTFAYAILG